jgi:hypothetical protein
MSLTLLTNTYANEFSGNSHYLRYSTNNYIEVAGVKSSWDLIFSSAPGYGEQFGFTSNVLSTTFAFLTGASTSYQHHLTPRSGTVNSTMTNLIAAEVNAFSDFSLYYECLALSNGIRIRAKNTGADYSMFSRAATSGASSTYVAGVTEVLRPNFKAILRLFKIDFTTGAETLVATKSINQLNGYAEVDIKEYLYSLRSWGFAHSTTFNIITPVQKYVLEFTESYGVPPIQQAITKTSELVSIPARVATWYFNAQKTPAPTIDLFFKASGNVCENILSIAPRINRRICSEMYDYLDFYCATAYTTIKVEYVALYSDGTTKIAVRTYNPSILEDQLFRCSIHVGRITAIHTTPVGIRLVGFNVTFLDNVNAPISGTINYLIDDDNYLNRQQFVFQNKYWSIDSLTCTGATIEQNEFERNTTNFVGQYPLDKKLYSKVNGVTQERTFTQYTGWLREDEVSLFEDMLSSENVKVYDEQMGVWKNITITTKKLVLRETQNGMFAYEFEYNEEATV